MGHMLVVDHERQLCAVVQHALEGTAEYRVSYAGTGEP